jgi:hypothetical protein
MGEVDSTRFLTRADGQAILQNANLAYDVVENQDRAEQLGFDDFRLSLKSAVAAKHGPIVAEKVAMRFRYWSAAWQKGPEIEGLSPGGLLSARLKVWLNPIPSNSGQNDAKAIGPVTVAEVRTQKLESVKQIVRITSAEFSKLQIIQETYGCETALIEAEELLVGWPENPTEATKQFNCIRKVLDDLQKLRNHSAAASGNGEMLEELDEVISLLSSRKQRLMDLPLSFKSVFEAKLIYAKAVQLWLQTNMAANGGSSKLLDLAKELVDAGDKNLKRAETSEYQGFYEDPKAAERSIKEYRRTLRQIVNAAAQKAVTESSVARRFLNFLFRRKPVGLRIESRDLNDAKFRYLRDKHEFKKKTWRMAYRRERGWQTLSGTLTPARKISAEIKNDYAKRLLKSVPSHAFAENEHATALYASTLFKKSPEGEDQFLMANVRHGVLSAIDIEDLVKRREANKKRAVEVMKAAYHQALITNIQVKQNTYDYIKQQSKGAAKPIEFPVLSISLLTPDWLRGFTGRSHFNEKRMWEDQLEALQAISGKPIKVTLDDGSTVQVVPGIIACNFGVNGGALGEKSVAGNRVSMGWGNTVEVANASAIKDLKGQAAIWLEGNADDIARLAPDSAEKLTLEKNGEVVRQLIEQIDVIYAAQSYRRDGGDGYKMVSRIAVLGYRIGTAVAINCKSGKDRTSQGVAAANALSAAIDERLETAKDGKYVPEPGPSGTIREKRNESEMLFAFGHTEVQKANTGFPGFKLRDVTSLRDRQPSEWLYNAFLGLSRLTGA